MTQSKLEVISEEASGSRRIEIRPSDIHISTSDQLRWGGFGKSEVEIAAGRLVRFFQSKGYWGQFTFKELIDFYTARQWPTESLFFGLMGFWYDDNGLGCWRESKPCIALYSDGKMAITKEFIETCFYGAGKYAT